MTVSVGNVVFGGDRLALIAGPCQLESRDHALMMAEAIAQICDGVIDVVFKASFDKANRTRKNASRGVGLEAAVSIFEEVRQFLPVLTDVHAPEQCTALEDAVDALQIPAFLCRQTDLLIAAAETGLPVNVKKGQFMAPEQTRHIVDKIGGGVILTERGTTFGHGDLVVDMRGLGVMAEFAPVVFDATHSVQRAGDGLTGGDRRFVAPLARAAVAAGVDGVFIETHEDPVRAPSDAASMLPLDQLAGLIKSLVSIDQIRRQT